MNFIRRIFSENKGDSSRPVGRFTSSQRSIDEVVKRVDSQIGRAVKRLAER